MDEVMAMMTKGFSEKEKKTLYDLLERATENLKGVADEDLVQTA